MTDTAATATLTRRRVKLGDLKLELQHWSNPRSFTGLDDDALTELGRNIKANGIEVPPHVVRVMTKTGQQVDLVIDGQRRVRAATRVLPETTLIEVFDLEKEAIELTPQKAVELLGRALNIGQNRETISSYELSEAAEKLRADRMTMGQIARLVNKSDTWVSKMLKARSQASPVLMLAWKKGDVTDEMFKELAELDQGKQSEALKAAKSARESGDKAGARATVKETLQIVKQETEKKKESARETPRVVNGHTKTSAPVVKGPQEELFERKADKRDADAVKPPSKVVLEDMRQMFEKKPPTDAYVKGLMHGVNFALGFTNPEKFANPWVVYLARAEGRAVKSPRHASRKSKKVAKARRPAKKAKKSGKKARR